MDSYPSTKISVQESPQYIDSSRINEICEIPTGIRTCETDDKLRCEFCKQFVLGFSDSFFRCAKYSTRKQKVPILNISNGRHLRLAQCLLENE